MEIIANNIPFTGFVRAPNFNDLGTLIVTTLALHALSNLPGADALGHFWKSVNEKCYTPCKDISGWQGLTCFSACLAVNHYTN